MKKYSAFAILSVFALSACVNPERVPEKTINDANMSCQDIANEMGQITSLREEAKKGTGASGANIAAALLFWPAAVGNYMNATDALKAAEKREAVLIGMAQQRNCKIQ